MQAQIFKKWAGLRVSKGRTLTPEHFFPEEEKRQSPVMNSSFLFKKPSEGQGKLSRTAWETGLELKGAR